MDIDRQQLEFRVLLVQLSNQLSNSNREELHFILGDDVPRNLRDDHTPAGTLHLLEFLFDRALISVERFDCLIHAFHHIGCHYAIEQLNEYKRFERQRAISVSSSPSSSLGLPPLDELTGNFEEDKLGSFSGFQPEEVQLQPETITSSVRPLASSSKLLESMKGKVDVDGRLFMSDCKWAFKIRTRCQLSLVVFSTVGIVAIILALVFVPMFLQPKSKTGVGKGLAKIKKNVTLRDIRKEIYSILTFSSTLLPQSALQLGALSLSARPGDGICAAATWVQNATTVAGGHGLGPRLNQLNSPLGLFVDNNQTVYVADTSNHRIVKWDRGTSNGVLVAGQKGQENHLDQLNNPRDVVVNKDGTMYISDGRNERVQRWSRGAQSGQTIIDNIFASGIALDDQESLYVSDWPRHEVKKWRVGEKIGQVITSGLYHPHRLFVDRNRSVYVADANNHRVIKVDDGTTKISIVAGGSYGNGTNQLAFPRGVAVDQLGTVYVADTENHRIMRWPRGAMSGSIIAGSHGAGSRSNQLHGPNDLSFDQDGNLYVVDHYNHRVQRFAVDKSLC